MRVLDACAAPGGKTLHILERAERCELVAADSDATRLLRVRDNLDRCRRNAQLVVADLATGRAPDGATAAALAAGGFDRILLDAPCSATGVIRRHPDIRLLRREADIASFAATQLALLEYAATRLAAGRAPAVLHLLGTAAGKRCGHRALQRRRRRAAARDCRRSGCWPPPASRFRAP